MVDLKAIVVCLVVVVVSGCGGGKSPTAVPSPVPTLDPTVVASWAKDAVKASVISSSDLPGGWTGSPREPSRQVGLSSQCRELDSAGFDGQLAYAASDRLRGPDRDAMNSEASAFASDKGAPY